MSWRLFLCLLALSGPMQICVDACPDDDAQGQCAPDCSDCSCCHSVVALTPVTPSLISILRAEAVAEPLPAVSLLDPEEIRHVPKARA